MMDRKTFFSLFHAARMADRIDYARSLAADWLTRWPGDREAQRLTAELEIEQKLYGSAIDRLTPIIVADPEDASAYRLLASAHRASGDPVQAAVYRGCELALRGEIPNENRVPSWTQSLARAIRQLDSEDGTAGLSEIQDALLADPSLPLPTWIAVRAHRARGDKASALSLARAGLDRWPDCLRFRLLLSDHQLREGQTEVGVAAMHRCVAADPTAAVAREVLGQNHAYQSLWPDELAIDPSRPVPAEVSAVLGDNRLAGAPTPGVRRPAAPRKDRSEAAKEAPEETKPEHRPEGKDPAEAAMPDPEPWEAYDGPDPGTPATPEDSLKESLRSVREEFRRLAEQVNARPPTEDEEERSPAYILLTSKSRLIQVAGEDGLRRVDEAGRALAKAVRQRPGWSAYQLYVDEPKSLKPFNLTPVDPGNAWQIKLRLADLDASLAERGEMIGAVLIIGGHPIVPFHMLPNPTDDEDDEVPSDNPYATRDENYFVPEWAVGRLPSGDPDLLARQLRSAADEHGLAARPRATSGLRAWLAAHLSRWFGLGSQSVGYTASVWKKASMVVFRSIGEPGRLLSSPPVEAANLPASSLKPTTLSYYNLHGLQDAPEWYGQRDPLRDQPTGEAFPVALRVKDVVNSGRAPKIVFTEACYGAHVIGKTADTALALRFLDQGSHAVIGSTMIAYGSVTPPLIAADLLGRRFWVNLKQQLPVGEALRRAKLELAQEMHKRQGYLDGEDQKALISFVLYGDPLFAPRRMAAVAGKKAVIRRRRRPTNMKTACALGSPASSQQELDEDSQAKIKSIVSQYLPGMAGATCTIHHQHSGCDADDHECPSRQLGIKGLPQRAGQPKVVTLSQKVSSGGRHHPHYARLTLDENGKVLKLAVSR